MGAAESLFPPSEKLSPVAAGAVVVEVVVAGFPKGPDPKIEPVALVVDALAVGVPFSPGAVVVPPKSPLFSLGVATKKGFNILD